ncbi:MAG: EAL domain-containing protein [Candidatus Brocadiales bacterium]|nr:EAL domain-containing protein [Candidatus Brocadiales bacterium]
MFRSIKSRLLTFILCVALISITVVTVADYLNFRHSLKKQTLAWMSEIAASRKNHILSIMEQLEQQTVGFSMDEVLQKYLMLIDRGEFLRHEYVTALNRDLSEKKKSVNPYIAGIAVADAAGTVIASTSEKTLDADMSGEDEFTRATNGCYVGKPRYDPQLNVKVIPLSAPIFYAQSGEKLGVIVISYDLNVLNSITAQRTGLGETGEIYIVGEDKKMITVSRFIEDAPLEVVVDTEPVRMAIEGGENMVGIYPDYRNIPIAGASAYIPEYKWTLLSEIDVAEAFAPLKWLGIVTGTVGGICTAAASTFAILFAMSMARPIKRLTTDVERFASGDIKARTDVTRRDEIGGLAKGFNVMAGELEKEITGRERREVALRKLSLAVEQSPNVVLITDAQGSIEYVNPRFTQVTGYAPEEVIGKNPRILKSGKTPPEVYKRLWETITSGGEWRGEFCNKKKNGELYWESAVISPIKNAEGVITHFVGSAEDTTERKQAEEKLNQLAYYDPLTGLPNRTLLNDRLTVAIAHAHRSKEGLAVLLLDLDRFKYVNDSLGHSVGDHLLMAVAKTLKTCVREGDTVSRLGGDEFTVLLPGIIHKEDPSRVAKKILEAVRKPLDLGGHTLHTTVSIGISLYPNDGKDVETLLRNADTAMYHVKAKDRNNYQHYTSAMHTKIADRLTLEDDLHKATEREEFVLYYQPQVDVKTGRITGVESLIRWQHPKRGLLSPMEFIHVAEDTGLIIPLSEWVLRTACAQGKSWQDVGLTPLRITVNLSAHTFLHPHLIETVSDALRKTNLAPRLLELEITEGTIMQSIEVTTHRLRELNSLGINIAIDDFGTGYSSLSYIKSFPIQKLKIDKSFVRDITTDPNDAAIVTAIITMAHKLGLAVVAEGVETVAQLEFLRSLECDEIQGYLFSKPVPAEEFEKMLAQDKRLQDMT